MELHLVHAPLLQTTIAVHMTAKAFQPYQLGPITLANRLVMAPMTRSRALGNVPNEMMAEYYRQRASAGLIVTEGTAPEPAALGYARIPGLFTREQTAGWRRITDAVHDEGGHIYMQLLHTGRVFHELNLPAGAVGVAPSAIAADGQMWTDTAQMQPNGTPRGLDAGELRRARDSFAHAATLAREAGFDGVELHGANGYLLEQFLNPASNQRTDEYGGSVQNRARFVLEAARGVADAIGADRTAIRLSPWGTFNDMLHYPEIDATYAYLAEGLQKIGVVYVHLVDHSRLSGQQAADATVTAIRGVFRGTLINSGNYATLDDIEATLESGRADLVAIARPFISNPDLVERLRAGQSLATPDSATFYGPGPNGFADGYTDYPVAAASLGG
jgi:N-ethylmaleimide reductase